MKQQNKNRVVFIPGWYDNLIEFNKLHKANIPEFELYNFGGNLTVQLESKLFKDDNDLKGFILKEFLSINFPETEIDVEWIGYGKLLATDEEDIEYELYVDED